MASANQCISMFVEALLFRPGWRHLTPGEGGEKNTLLTIPGGRTRTPRRHESATTTLHPHPNLWPLGLAAARARCLRLCSPPAPPPTHSRAPRHPRVAASPACQGSACPAASSPYSVPPNSPRPPPHPPYPRPHRSPRPNPPPLPLTPPSRCGPPEDPLTPRSTLPPLERPPPRL